MRNKILRNRTHMSNVEKLRQMQKNTKNNNSRRTAERVIEHKMTAGSGFGQKKMSDPTLGADSYNETRSRVGQCPNVLTLELSEKID